MKILRTFIKNLYYCVQLSKKTPVCFYTYEKVRGSHFYP